MILVRAPIESVELRVAESFSAQYFIEAVSLLPDGCETFGEIDVTRNGTTVQIDV